MDAHRDAPLTPKGREMMVRAVIEGGLSKAEAARRFNTTPKTVAKWMRRFEAEGVEGLRDRSSRPLSSPSQTAPGICATVEALRRRRHTGKQIAAEVGVSAATVSRVLRRLGLNRLLALEPAQPIRCYERATQARSATPVESDGSMCIWRSMTIRASLTQKSCQTKNEAHAFAFSSTVAFLPLGRQGPPRHDPQRLQAFAPAATPRRCACSKSSICAPGPDRQVFSCWI
jgi:transposase